MAAAKIIAQSAANVPSSSTLKTLASRAQAVLLSTTNTPSSAAGVQNNQFSTPARKSPISVNLTSPSLPFASSIQTVPINNAMSVPSSYFPFTPSATPMANTTHSVSNISSNSSSVPISPSKQDIFIGSIVQLMSAQAAQSIQQQIEMMHTQLQFLQQQYDRQLAFQEQISYIMANHHGKLNSQQQASAFISSLSPAHLSPVSPVVAERAPEQIEKTTFPSFDASNNNEIASNEPAQATFVSELLVTNSIASSSTPSSDLTMITSSSGLASPLQRSLSDSLANTSYSSVSSSNNITSDVTEVSSSNHKVLSDADHSHSHSSSTTRSSDEVKIKSEAGTISEVSSLTHQLASTVISKPLTAAPSGASHSLISMVRAQSLPNQQSRSSSTSKKNGEAAENNSSRQSVVPIKDYNALLAATAMIRQRRETSNSSSPHTPSNNVIKNQQQEDK
jgi:hypothetical protein